jgi:FtsH-binding integral membrane protein
VIGVIVFVGLTAYDTQQIRASHTGQRVQQIRPAAGF